MGSNPVMKEILGIKHQWEAETKAHPEVRLFRWLGSKLELQLVDSFIKFQMSEQAYGNDTFVEFVNEFNSPNSFGQEIFKDIDSLLHDWYDQLKDEDKAQKVRWEASNQGYHGQEFDSEYFVSQINRFCEYHELKAHEKLVVVFLPASVANFNQFTKWLNLVASSKLSPQIKLVVFDTYGWQVYDSLVKYLRSLAITLFPKVNSEKMITQTLEAAKNRSTKPEPGLEFQKWMIKASFALGKGNAKEALANTEKSLCIARVHQLAQLESVCHIFRSNVYLSQSEASEALSEIELAIRTASGQKEQELQARILKGSILIMQKQTRSALEAYEECIPLIGPEDHAWSLEVNRLIGDCSLQIGNRHEASIAYTRCLVAGEGMPEEYARLSTLPLAAEQLLKLSAAGNNEKESLAFRIEKVLGADWRSLSKRFKTKRTIEHVEKQGEE